MLLSSGSDYCLIEAVFLKSLIEMNALLSLGGGRALSTRSGEVAENFKFVGEAEKRRSN